MVLGRAVHKEIRLYSRSLPLGDTYRPFVEIARVGGCMRMTDKPNEREVSADPRVERDVGLVVAGAVEVCVGTRQTWFVEWAYIHDAVPDRVCREQFLEHESTAGRIPAGMPYFDGEPQMSRPGREPLCQVVDVAHAKSRRELQKIRALARSQRLHPFEELIAEVDGICQGSSVADEFGDFATKPERCWGFDGPLGDRRHARDCIERRIPLDRGNAFAVTLEKRRSGRPCGIQRPDPAFVSPDCAAGTDVHGSPAAVLTSTQAAFASAERVIAVSTASAATPSSMVAARTP